MLSSSPSKLLNLSGLTVKPESVVQTENAEFGFARQDGEARLVISTSDTQLLTDFEGERSSHTDGTVLVGPTSANNAARMRMIFSWLKPRPLGTQTSAGFGDRLGLATPGHIRALRAVGGHIAPIFAQQSIREMTRTDRSAQQVLDDAIWGVFAEGWREGFGADADHLKTPENIDRCVATGFTFFTIDPGEYVDDRAAEGGDDAMRKAFAALPWAQLKDTEQDTIRRYTKNPIQLETRALPFDEATLMRAAAKYGKVVAHVQMMYEHLQQVSVGQPFELEISVDETDSITTHAEHIYLATEFARLGVQFISLAPRYVGRFEKGVDYIGDLDVFWADFAFHAEIARKFGNYKLSLHSGSDKFSVYPIAAELTKGRVHLKTAGTSYLEALRTIAALDPNLFRAIYAFGREHYETDRASYHVSATLDKASTPESIADADLPILLDQFDARQVLHVTFGSTLTARDANGQFIFKDRLLGLLKQHPDDYAQVLEKHFIRHLAPFVKAQD